MADSVAVDGRVTADSDETLGRTEGGGGGNLELGGEPLALDGGGPETGSPRMVFLEFAERSTRGAVSRPTTVSIMEPGNLLDGTAALSVLGVLDSGVTEGGGGVGGLEASATEEGGGGGRAACPGSLSGSMAVLVGGGGGNCVLSAVDDAASSEPRWSKMSKEEPPFTFSLMRETLSRDADGGKKIPPFSRRRPPEITQTAR